MLIVMKFGGSLLASKGGISRVAGTVCHYSRRNKVVVVVSALGGVTDMLLEAADSAQNSDGRRTLELTRRIKVTQTGASDQISARRATDVARTQEELFEALRKILEGVSFLRELTPRSKDLIASFGERLSAPIVSAAIEDAGLRAKALTGAQAGIITNDSFGEAYPEFTQTRATAKKVLLPLLSKGVVPVVTGFIAGTRSGEITTLGRGGSDYTATILADAIDADEVWIWTDVDGIMTADPRVVPDATVIRELSYAEAEEMAFFGAKNMHPLALGPARLREIPVRIRNGYKTELPGTLIDGLERRKEGVAKAIMLVRKVGMMTVSGETLMGRPGTAAGVFQTLGKQGVNVLMISQSVSESNISFVIKRESLEKARSALESGMNTSGPRAKIDVEPDVAVVAAVGAGMKGTPGVAAKVFGAVAHKGINVRMIAQGSSELNISFVVKEKVAERAVQALHSELVAHR